MGVEGGGGGGGGGREGEQRPGQNSTMVDN